MAVDNLDLLQPCRKSILEGRDGIDQLNAMDSVMFRSIPRLESIQSWFSEWVDILRGSPKQFLAQIRINGLSLP